MARLTLWFIAAAGLTCLTGCGGSPGSGNQKPQSEKYQPPSKTFQPVGAEKPEDAFKRLVAKKEEALKAKKIEYKNLKSSFEPATAESPPQGRISFQFVDKGKTFDAPFEGDYEFKDGKWQSTHDMGGFDRVPPVISTDEDFMKRVTEAQRTLSEK